MSKELITMDRVVELFDQVKLPLDPMRAARLLLRAKTRVLGFNSDPIDTALFKTKVHILCATLRALAFNPDQPRDDRGQWTDSGSDTQEVDLLKTVSDVVEGEDSALDSKDRAMNPLIPDYAHTDDEINIDELTDEVMEGIADHYSMKTIEESTEASKTTKGIIQSIDIADIDSSQPTLSRATLRKYIKTKGWEKEAAIGLKENGRVLLIDGNHRVVALKLRGEKTANIRIINIKKRNLGGLGSGNFGHSGRPGEVGGSGGSGGAIGSLKEAASGKKFIEINQKNPVFKHLTSTDREIFLRDYKLIPDARKAGNTIEKEVDLTTIYGTQKSIEVQQVAELIENPKLGIDTEDGLPLIVRWDGRLLIGDGHHRLAASLFRGKKRETVEYLDLDAYKTKIRAAGGLGSGNFGHSGRPGEIGGSAATDGSGADSRSSEWFSSLKAVSGPKGTNPGGVHVDADGQKWYVKKYKDPDQGAAEHISNEIYKAVGVKVPHSVIGPHGEFATEWESNAGQTLGRHGVDKQTADAILDGFAADVFVMNWDAVGTGHDNVLVSKTGAMTRIDQGGTLTFRAQGASKPTELLHEIGEWDTLSNPARNSYYAEVFKAAGVKNADTLGSRVVKQIDRIADARPKDGWRGFVERTVPHASTTFKNTVGEMLEARQAKLEKKAEKIRGGIRAAYNPDQPRVPAGDPDGGKWTAGGEFGVGDVIKKAKKAPKAPPVSKETKDKAYEMVKSGKTFKQTALELGMTQGQVAGHVWKVDQKKAAVLEEMAKQAEVTKPIEPPKEEVVTKEAKEEAEKQAAADLHFEKIKQQMADEKAKAEIVEPTKPPTVAELKAKAYEMVKSGKTFKQTAAELGLTTGQVAGHVWKVDQKAKKAAFEKTTEEGKKEEKPTPVTPPSTPVEKEIVSVKPTKEVTHPEVPTAYYTHKVWHAMDQDEKIGLATQQGYVWKEKTYGPKKGEYAWFDANGVQVSAPNSDKGAYAKAIDTINYGKGLAIETPATTIEGWPIDNKVVRTAGENYPKVVEKTHQPWINSLNSDERTAFSKYTGHYSGEINTLLRTNGTFNYDAKLMQSAIDRAPTPPPPELVWRGISSAFYNKISHLGVGDSVTMAGFQSSSINPNFASSWGKNVPLLEIKPAKGAYVRKLSIHKQEYEYILPHGAEYVLRGVTKIRLSDSGELRSVVQLEMRKK